MGSGVSAYVCLWVGEGGAVVCVCVFMCVGWALAEGVGARADKVMSVACVCVLDACGVSLFCMIRVSVSAAAALLLLPLPLPCFSLT